MQFRPDTQALRSPLLLHSIATIPEASKSRGRPPWKFGLSIPTRGPRVTPKAIRALAAKAEESSFARIAIADCRQAPGPVPSGFNTIDHL